MKFTFFAAKDSPFNLSSDIKSTQSYLGESKDEQSFKAKFSLFTLTSDRNCTFFAAKHLPFNLISDIKSAQSDLYESKKTNLPKPNFHHSHWQVIRIVHFLQQSIRRST